MKSEDAAIARAILAQFPTAYVVIGSFASLLRGEVALDNVGDVDVLVADDPRQIEVVLRYLETQDFELRIWGAPFARPVNRELLAAKHYVRATRGSLQVDVTFDLANIPFVETHRTGFVKDGLTVSACPAPRSSSKT